LTPLRDTLVTTKSREILTSVFPAEAGIHFAFESSGNFSRQTGIAQRKSMINPKRICVVLLALLLVIFCDQATKDMARSRLPKTRIIPVAGSLLSFNYYENKGGEFSFE
jgi:hypothetical protein